jgi:hypothetical protein
MGNFRELHLESRGPLHRKMALMRQIRSSSWVILAAASVVSIGCQPEAAPTVRSTTTAGATDIYVKSVSDTLNNLPAALDLNLLPAQPILTASTSSDGKEVRALLIRNPANPEGPINYLQAVDGNANFATLDVKAGDIVRYYVNLDADALERNLEERTALQLRVRRRDATDPENVLLLEVGTDAPVLEPQRIEVWRYSDKRADAIRSMLATYVNNHRPPAGWEPSPDLAALQQIVERANQWLRNLPPTDEKWTPTPLIATWPEELRQAPGARTVITEDNLAATCRCGCAATPRRISTRPWRCSIGPSATFSSIRRGRRAPRRQWFITLGRR